MKWRGRYGRERDIAVVEYPEEEEYSVTAFTPSVDQLNPVPLIDEAVGSLQDYLRTRKASPWAINGAAIYQRAFEHLYQSLQRTALPEYLQVSALEELALLAKTVQHIFTGRARFTSQRHNPSLHAFEGYSTELSDRQNRFRTTVRTERLPGGEAPMGWDILPRADVMVADIVGRNSRGGAIAADDSHLRCSVKAMDLTVGFAWTLCIDSGHSIPCADSFDKKRWKVIRPLSQAIGLAKKDPQSGILSPGEVAEGYTYYYTDLTTQGWSPLNTQQRFDAFNDYLLDLFQTMAPPRSNVSSLLMRQALRA